MGIPDYVSATILPVFPAHLTDLFVSGVGHGTADQICEYQACRNWYGSVDVKDKEMRVYEGWFHKLHAEPGDDKVRFAGDVSKWILERCDPIAEDQATAEAKPKL